MFDRQALLDMKAEFGALTQTEFVLFRSNSETMWRARSKNGERR